jgi:hypothetical protein
MDHTSASPIIDIEEDFGYPADDLLNAGKIRVL